YNASDLCVQHDGCTYHLVRHAVNFASAEMHCRRFQNGRLVSIHNYCQNQAVYRLTRKGCRALRVWIGGFELFKSYKFIWTDGSSWNYNNWVPGQPDNTANVEDCVEMNWHTRSKWNDHGCYNRKPFVCHY
uniref:C-type lectin domain-containing protein n=2 Tax=Latimeria chalumnae TaxID=7897 RepID=H2ZUB7_LATCH